MNYFIIKKINQQTTLKKPFIIRGRSLLRNLKVILKCCPSKANSGLIFKINNQSIRVSHKNFKKSNYLTSQLIFNKAKVITVEHILSALYGMQIDNAIIEIKGDNQLPILDGSSFLYARKIIQVGRKYLNCPLKSLKVKKPLLIKSKNNDSFAFLLPSNNFIIQTVIDFDNLIGLQELELVLNTPKEYYKKVCRARTFFIKPFAAARWQKLRNCFLGLPDNPINSCILTYNKKQFITPLRFLNEPVRHKILDFIGDLALLGYRLEAKIFLFKPGHNFNYFLVRKINQIINNK